MAHGAPIVYLEVPAKDLGRWLHILEWLAMIDVGTPEQDCPGHSDEVRLPLSSRLFPEAWDGRSLGVLINFAGNSSGKVTWIRFQCYVDNGDLDVRTYRRADDDDTLEWSVAS